MGWLEDAEKNRLHAIGDRLLFRARTRKTSVEAKASHRKRRPKVRADKEFREVRFGGFVVDTIPATQSRLILKDENSHKWAMGL